MHKYFSTGQYKNIITLVHERAHFYNIPAPTLTFQGTVKLHGTNGAIYNKLINDDIVTQSKNNIITPLFDNAGFSKHIDNHKSLIKNIFDNLKSLYPEAIQDKTAVIYGEWCGGNIQENVAISALNKMFVIFGIKLIENNPINTDSPQEQWLVAEEISQLLNLSNISLLNHNQIYNIYDFPTFNVTIDLANPKSTQQQLINYTNAVEKECPVAKSFGISGLGEGIVWKCISPHPLIRTYDLVFKVKGKEHAVHHAKTIAEVDVQKVNSINEFIDHVVTSNRLKQGIEYLYEQHLYVTNQNIGVFLKWIVQDCLKEEQDTLVASGLNQKDITPAINTFAKTWYFKLINNHPDLKEIKINKPKI